MDLYCKMGEELRSLFKDLFDPTLEKQALQKIGNILSTATQIGGSLQKEAERLNQDVLKFLKKRDDEKLAAIMKQHALRLEQETREL